MNIFDFIKTEEPAYKATSIPVAEGYEWNMYEHVRKSTLYRDSKFTEGANDGTRPFKNIIRRIVNFQHYATGFDVKDIEPFVNDPANYYKSFLARKYHPKWARKNDLDTFIDELVESYVDFGLALVKRVPGVRPEVVPLQSLAFVDQTDVLSGPICIKHQYSPSQLKGMEQHGWGKSSNGATTTINELITLARREKVNPNGQVTQTPGKFIEVYELDGTFPKEWLDDEETTDQEEHVYTQQFAIVAFYQDDNGDKKGLKLFHSKGDPDKYKALKRDPIFGRACGFGAIEELFEPQVWVNYNAIRIQQMLDTASKWVGVTDDSGFANRNRLSEVDNGEFLTIADGKTAGPLNTQPINAPLFEKASINWEQHAQELSSATDAVLGDNPTAGTPFKLQQALIMQGKGPHDYRKGKVATFVSELYRDWFLNDLVKEMNQGQDFLEELTMDEMEYVATSIVDCEAGTLVKNLILSGQIPDPQKVDAFKQQVRDQFMKGGTKRFHSIVANEFKDFPVDVEVNVAGKQKDLSHIADKLSNVISQIIANPQGFVQLMQIPAAAKAFNQLMEASGLDQLNFSTPSPIQLQQQVAQPQQQQPQQAPVQPPQQLPVAQ